MWMLLFGTAFALSGSCYEPCTKADPQCGQTLGIGTRFFSVPGTMKQFKEAMGGSNAVQLVMQVYEGCPSESLLRRNDLVFAINGEPLATRRDLKIKLCSLTVGESVTVSGIRGGSKPKEPEIFEVELPLMNGGFVDGDFVCSLEPVQTRAKQNAVANYFRPTYSGPPATPTPTLSAGASTAPSTGAATATSGLSSNPDFGSGGAGSPFTYTSPYAPDGTLPEASAGPSGGPTFGDPCALVTHLESTHSSKPDYPSAKARVQERYPEVKSMWDKCTGGEPSGEAAPVTEPAAGTQSTLEQLQQLKALLDSGAIDQAEFDRLKARILGG